MLMLMLMLMMVIAMAMVTMAVLRTNTLDKQWDLDHEVLLHVMRVRDQSHLQLGHSRCSCACGNVKMHFYN